MTELRRRMILAMTIRGYSPRTHESYLRAIREMAKYYRRSPDELSVEEVQSYLAYLIRERGRASSSVNVVVSAYRFLNEMVLRRHGVALEVPYSKQPQRVPEILSREEVGRLLAAPPNPKHRLLLATIYACGLRVSEAMRLKTSDVDRGRMTVRIVQGNGRKDRMVPLSRRLLEQMEEHWKTNPPQRWLFPNRLGKRPIDITVAQKVFSIAKLQTGITKQGGIHGLRHAFVTHLIEDGANVPTVQQLLGHASMATTMRYFHLSETQFKSLSSPLDRLDRPRA
jgi:site-specific recombinase XerD